MVNQNQRKSNICYTIIGDNLFFSYYNDIMDNRESEPIERIENFMYSEYYIKPIAVNSYIVRDMSNLSVIIAKLECMDIVYSSKLTSCKRKFKYEYN